MILFTVSNIDPALNEQDGYGKSGVIRFKINIEHVIPRVDTYLSCNEMPLADTINLDSVFIFAQALFSPHPLRKVDICIKPVGHFIRYSGESYGFYHINISSCRNINSHIVLPFSMEELHILLAQSELFSIPDHSYGYNFVLAQIYPQDARNWLLMEGPFAKSPPKDLSIEDIDFYPEKPIYISADNVVLSRSWCTNPNQTVDFYVSSNRFLIGGSLIRNNRYYRCEAMNIIHFKPLRVFVQENVCFNRICGSSTQQTPLSVMIGNNTSARYEPGYCEPNKLSSKD